MPGKPKVAQSFLRTSPYFRTRWRTGLPTVIGAFRSGTGLPSYFPPKTRCVVFSAPRQPKRNFRKALSLRDPTPTRLSNMDTYSSQPKLCVDMTAHTLNDQHEAKLFPHSASHASFQLCGASNFEDCYDPDRSLMVEGKATCGGQRWFQASNETSV